MQSISKKPPAHRAASALSRGRGSPCASTSATNSSSKSLRVIPAGTFDLSSARRFAAPGARGYRSSRSGSDTRPVSPRTSASFIARSSSRFEAIPAKSNIVRDTEVTGIPSMAGSLIGCSDEAWTWIPLGDASPVDA